MGQETISCFRVWGFWVSWDKNPEWEFGGTWFGAQERDELEIEILESIYRKSLKTWIRVKSPRENVYRMKRKGDSGLNPREHRSGAGREAEESV